MSIVEISDVDKMTKPVEGKGLKSLNDLANFVGKTSMPRKHRSDFWNAYKFAVSSDDHQRKPKSVSELLSVVLTISARTRRIVSPKTDIELDVFMPNGRRAVQLIMGKTI